MILVLNCGSQSIKWKVFDDKLKVVQEGRREILNPPLFKRILIEELEKLKNKNLKISKIGHRVVHGKDIFVKPTPITPESLQKIESLSYLAPLHNPFNILGIKACHNVFGGVPQIAVFDTEFFKDLPEVAFIYPLPEEIRKEFGFRKYGFHGISHEYVAKKAANILKRPFEKLKIITCHLGGGASITAIKGGRAVDTSMGFTPMQGLVMMTRAGDLDSGIVLELVRRFGPDKTENILNKESGVKGICNEKEMLKILSKLNTGREKNKYRLALDVFIYSVKKYIGAYYAILGGCNALVFTGAIGAGDPRTREMICGGLNILKKTKIMAIETDEELAIAQKIL